MVEPQSVLEVPPPPAGALEPDDAWLAAISPYQMRTAIERFLNMKAVSCRAGSPLERWLVLLDEADLAHRQGRADGRRRARARARVRPGRTYLERVKQRAGDRDRRRGRSLALTALGSARGALLAGFSPLREGCFMGRGEATEHALPDQDRGCFTFPPRVRSAW